MPNTTFPCPFCGKKMAVGEAMHGKKVRCPSCKQVVLAPGAPPPPPPPAKPKTAKIAPPAPADDDLPVFKVQPRESHESIFSEAQESEDEVFGSNPEFKLRVPEMPESEKPKPPPVVISSPPPASDDHSLGFSNEPPTPLPPTRPKANPLVVEEVEPTADYSDPFGGFEDPPPQPISEVIENSVTTPPPPPPPPAAVPKAVVVEVVSPPPGNPWASFEEPTEKPTPVGLPKSVPVEHPKSAVKKAAVVVDDEAEEPPPVRETKQRTQRTPANVGERTGPGMGFYILVGYAILMTAMTIYGFAFRHGTQIDPGHPLSTIPDNFGEFPPAERKKTGQLNKIIDGELPQQQRVALGKRIEIGQLEIEPRKIETRPLELVSVMSGGNPVERVTQAPAVVMTLNIRNKSNDLAIHPMDPAFMRKFMGNTDEPKPGTSLVIGKEFIRGSDIAWPPTGRNAPTREYERSQENDVTPLNPGEARDYVVFTPSEKRIVDRVKGASEPLLWRVQVRRGVIELRGKEVPVTAIIGVEFRASDVREGSLQSRE